jgi:hypothetical protein
MRSLDTPGGAISTMRQRLGGDVSFIGFDPAFAYAGRRWLDCGIEQSARLEQAALQGHWPMIIAG